MMDIRHGLQVFFCKYLKDQNKSKNFPKRNKKMHWKEQCSCLQGKPEKPSIVMGIFFQSWDTCTTWNCHGIAYGSK